MAKNDTSYQPGSNGGTKRGKSKRTLILEAIRKSALVKVKKTATNDEIELCWFNELVARALDKDDRDSGLCIKLITERGWSALKPSTECVQFEFDKDGTPVHQATQVMAAVSNGEIPPDLGLAFVNGIKAVIEVEANVELKGRIEALEAMINGA